MDEPHILEALAHELERRGASVEQIQEYRTYFEGIQPNESVPCPNCYVFHREHGRLIPQCERRGMEPLKCRRCKEVFEVPIA